MFPTRQAAAAPKAHPSLSLSPFSHCSSEYRTATPSTHRSPAAAATAFAIVHAPLTALGRSQRPILATTGTGGCGSLLRALRREEYKATTPSPLIHPHTDAQTHPHLDVRIHTQQDAATATLAADAARGSDVPKCANCLLSAVAAMLETQTRTPSVRSLTVRGKRIRHATMHGLRRRGGSSGMRSLGLQAAAPTAEIVSPEAPQTLTSEWPPGVGIVQTPLLLRLKLWL